MVRTTSYDKNGIKKGIWSPEEDDKLRAYIQRYGHKNWPKLPRFAGRYITGLSRTGKSCRLRWMNYLRPNVKRGNYTEEEDELIIKLQEELGNKWCMIASKLPGRTDNEIKNHWHTKLKKRAKQNTITSEKEKDQSIETSECEPSQNKEVEHKTVLVDHASPINILESSNLERPYTSNNKIFSASLDHALSSGVNLATVNSIASPNKCPEFTGDFWTDELLLAADNYQYDSPPTIMAEGPFTFHYISYGDYVVDRLYL